MSLTRKVLLGLGAIWPAVYFVCFLGFFLFAVLTPGESLAGYQGYFAGIMVVHILTMVVGLVVVIFFVYDLWRNPAISADKRPLWLILLLLLGIAALPAYWYVHIWNRPPATA